MCGCEALCLGLVERRHRGGEPERRAGCSSGGLCVCGCEALCLGRVERRDGEGEPERRAGCRPLCVVEEMPQREALCLGRMGSGGTGEGSLDGEPGGAAGQGRGA